MTEASLVFVVEDDPSVRLFLKFQVITVGLRAETFESADSFLCRKPADIPSCLVLDVRLPGLSGLDFQRELAARNVCIPIVFTTGHGDIPMSVRAMKAGAIEFLTKPFRDYELLDAVRLALDRDTAKRKHDIAVEQRKSKTGSFPIPWSTVRLRGLYSGRRNAWLRRTCSDLQQLCRKVGIIWHDCIRGRTMNVALGFRIAAPGVHTT
jgi:FixJ family two-component response regulator